MLIVSACPAHARLSRRRIIGFLFGYSLPINIRTTTRLPSSGVGAFRRGAVAVQASRFSQAGPCCPGPSVQDCYKPAWRQALAAGQAGQRAGAPWCLPFMATWAERPCILAAEATSAICPPHFAAPSGRSGWGVGLAWGVRGLGVQVTHGRGGCAGMRVAAGFGAVFM